MNLSAAQRKDGKKLVLVAQVGVEVEKEMAADEGRTELFDSLFDGTRIESLTLRARYNDVAPVCRPELCTCRCGYIDGRRLYSVNQARARTHNFRGQYSCKLE